MLVKINSYSISGVSARRITIEVNVTNGAYFSIVGLPDNAVKESYQRVISALKNSDYPIPVKGITINLAPADIKKEGAGFDLPIAIGLLAATGQVSTSMLDETFIIGELSLGGELRPARGVLPMVIKAKSEGLRGAIIPHHNLGEACLIDGFSPLGFSCIREITKYFIDPKSFSIVLPNKKADKKQDFHGVDFGDVKGQQNIKRALEIAAAGGHNAMMVGPPGAGKSMLAKRIPSILPDLSHKDALETTSIYSVSRVNQYDGSLMNRRPFRSPHHTISDAALVGGGTNPRPGEISLAHNGVLYLDELPEFKRSVLESLRQPLEDGVISISRSRETSVFPANFMLIASMNPCPCGYYGQAEKSCVCVPGARSKYFNKISGPLLDRIDLHLEINPVPIEDLVSLPRGENSETIKARIEKCWDFQRERAQKSKLKMKLNSKLNPADMASICRLCASSETILKKAVNSFKLSARSYDRVLKVSRTIADLTLSESILPEHLAEAIQYRSLEKKY